MQNLRISKKEIKRANGIKTVWCYSFEGRKREVIVNGETQYKRTRLSKSGFKTAHEARTEGMKRMADYFSSKPSND